MQGATSPQDSNLGFLREASTKSLRNRGLHATALRTTIIRGLALRSPGRIASAMLVPSGSLRRHANAEKGAAKTRSNRHGLRTARMSD